MVDDFWEYASSGGVHHAVIYVKSAKPDRGYIV